MLWPSRLPKIEPETVDMSLWGGGRVLAMVRALTLLFSIVATTFAGAQPSGGPFCAVPAGGAPMPPYFYSTNNHVSGNAMVGPADGRGPRYFVYACLKVGGYTVDEYIHIVGEPQPMSIGGEATFDSTVFGNGTQLVVRFEAIDSYGVVYEAEDSAPVKNKIGLAQVDEWNDYLNTDGIERTRVLMENLGWDIHELSTMDWNPADLYDLFSGAGIYHIGVHGDVDRHWTDNWDEVLAQPFMINAIPNYFDWRASMNGTGLPPHNSTNIPPVTFAFLDSCYAGTNSDFFESILLPHMTSYGEYVENMCLIGYPQAVMVAGHDVAAHDLFLKLREGVVATKAREEFLDSNLARWIANPLSIYVVTISWGNIVDDESEMHLYGDPNTRVRWVYTGDENFAEEMWFK